MVVSNVLFNRFNRHHTLADGQGSFLKTSESKQIPIGMFTGFILSQMHMTSYFKELQERVNKGAQKLRAARTGGLRPSQINRSFKKFDFLTEYRATVPFVRLFLMLFFWIGVIFMAIISFFLSTYQGIHQAICFLLTSWRTEKVTPDYRGPRVKEREFSSSKILRMADVRLCQQAFSGPRPGGVFSKLEQGSPISYGRVAHVTLNDVICAVMADIIREEMAAKGERGMGPRGWKRVFQRFLPSPMGFFM